MQKNMRLILSPPQKKYQTTCQESGAGGRDSVRRIAVGMVPRGWTWYGFVDFVVGIKTGPRFPVFILIP